MIAAVLTGALVVPLTSVVRWLTRADAAAFGDVGIAALQTLGLALAGALCTIAVALPFAWLAVRYPSRLSRLLEGAAYLASSLPAIIVALAFVAVTLAFAPSLYQTAFTVVAAYVVIFLPRALVPLRAGLAQVPESRCRPPPLGSGSPCRCCSPRSARVRPSSPSARRTS
jgi:iron(III) transport system permease protein